MTTYTYTTPTPIHYNAPTIPTNPLPATIDLIMRAQFSELQKSINSLASAVKALDNAIQSLNTRVTALGG